MFSNEQTDANQLQQDPQKPANLKEFLARSVIVRNNIRDERLNYLEGVFKDNFCAICKCIYDRDFRKCKCGHRYCYYHLSNMQSTYLDLIKTDEYCIKCQPNKLPMSCKLCGEVKTDLHLVGDNLYYCFTCWYAASK